MSETTQFTFRIQNFTPETMPFGRILEYYQNLANMLGESEKMRLLQVFESSHASEIKFDGAAASHVTKRLLELKAGTAPQGAINARNNIGAMLAEDSTNATFEDARGNNVVEFPIPKLDRVEPIRIRDTAAFVGELYHIAGNNQDARVRLNTDDYGVVYCTTTKALAKEMRDFLFDDIRVSGRGHWTKNTQSGQWDIGSFTITDFTPVVTESLRDAVSRVRKLEIDWPDDPLGDLARINHEDDAA